MVTESMEEREDKDKDDQEVSGLSKIRDNGTVEARQEGEREKK